MSDSSLRSHPSFLKNELRVFISSTFRDLQEEGEHLIKKIFPEIRSLCRKRGVTFTDVDLRWGLTEEEAMLGRIIRTCLEEVDKCRPYFIGMIGNRYGWVPEYHEILMDPDLLAKYPWIEEIALEGASVTEMEFIHGVFDAPQVDGEYAFFYHRSGNIAEADDPERLGALIERVRGTGKPFREFQSIEELGEQVRDDLVRMIEQHWPQSQAPSALELERRAHSAFAASRIRAYIPNPLYLKEFTGWLSSGTKPLVMQGESGLGKSSLVAYLTEYYRTKNPTALVIEHYVGASQASGSALAVMRHIIEEIGARFGIDETLPAKEEELEKSFANWLYRCEHLATQAGVAVMIVIDAVNQLGESGRRLSWLPKTIPTGVNLLVSTTPGEAEDRLMEREWDGLLVRPLEDEEVRQSIVVRYLGEFHKGITPEQVRRVTGDPKGSSPLYLRVVAEELRLHGEHETIDQVIDRYIEAGDLLEVFDRVLERMERDYGKSEVQDVMSLIGASRSGLSESELLEIVGMRRLDLSRLLFAFDYHLIHRDGLLGFFHDYLRRAVEKRYLTDESTCRTERLRLIEYFEQQPPGVRTSREIAWQLEAMDDRPRLGALLSTIPHFIVLFQGEFIFEVLKYWSRLRGIVDMEEVMEAGLARWRSEQPGHHEVLTAIGAVAYLFMHAGLWSRAAGLQRERADIAVSAGDVEVEADVRLRLGRLLFMQGDRSGAFEETSTSRRLCESIGSREGTATAVGQLATMYAASGEMKTGIEYAGEHLRLCEELADRSGRMRALGNLGKAYLYLGEYEQSMKYLQQALESAEELGDRLIIAYIHTDMGNVLLSTGEIERALECYERDLAICEELGDQNGVAVALSNIAAAYMTADELDLAIASLQRQLEISNELGDRAAIAAASGNLGEIFMARGDYDRALELCERQLTIGRELGDRHLSGMGIGNMGIIYCKRGEHVTALECFSQAIEDHRDIGFRDGLAYWLQGTGDVLLTLAQTSDTMPGYLSTILPEASQVTWQGLSLQLAREQATECIAISTELSKEDTLFTSQVLLARIDHAEGRPGDAVQRLYTMLKEVTDDEQHAELRYWLFKLPLLHKEGAGGRSTADAEPIAGTPSNSPFRKGGGPDKGGSERENEEHRAEALHLYESLFEKTPKYEYRKRIDELTATIQPTKPEDDNVAA